MAKKSKAKTGKKKVVRRTEPKVDPTSQALIAAQNAFKEFLESNPLSKVQEVQSAKDRSIAVCDPWGDKSILLILPKEVERLASALNKVFLPARYSGIWHKDSKDFEILWTAFKLPGELGNITQRSFSFQFRGCEYHCEFGKTSERALTVAAAFKPAALSETGYRNLSSFNTYRTKQNGYESLLSEPLSFWIRKIDWNEDEVLALVSHLNFYINYFDAASPTILIHSPPPSKKTKSHTRFAAENGAFPRKMRSQEIDTNQLFLWEAAHKGEVMHRFLYFYRIIEYASAMYLDSTARTALRIALALPNALDDITTVTESVVAAVQRTKMDDFNRYETMLKETIEPKLLWRELALNLDAFTSDTQFDGGYSVAALFGKSQKAEEFNSQNVLTFGRAIREMRNALSHGRDQKTGTTISPTVGNAAKLRPWIGPVRLAASQVVLYKGVF